MDNEYTLAQQAFLLCYHLDKQRMARTDFVDYMTRSAALIELYQGGQLTDDGGKPAVVRGAKVSDPALAAVLAEVETGAPKSWTRWVRRNAKTTKRAVRETLVDKRAVALDESKVLGLIPHTKTTVKDTRAVKAVRAKVKDALRAPASQVDPVGAALVAVAAAVELGFVLDRGTRREYKERIAKCMEIAGPAAKGLRSLVRQRRSAAIAAGNSGGS